MPRSARVVPESGIFHIITRGNNKMRVFNADSDYKRYLFVLGQLKIKHKIIIYHYCLMPNHVHIILETCRKSNLSVFMKSLNLSYFQYFKRKYGYSGHFWQDRYKSFLIQKDRYLLACGIYIEYNPVRAGIVNDPSKYIYSSHNSYLNKTSGLITPNPLLMELGNDEDTRIKLYKEYFDKRYEYCP